MSHYYCTLACLVCGQNVLPLLYTCMSSVKMYVLFTRWMRIRWLDVVCFIIILLVIPLVCNSFHFAVISLPSLQFVILLCRLGWKRCTKIQIWCLTWWAASSHFTTALRATHKLLPCWEMLLSACAQEGTSLVLLPMPMNLCEYFCQNFFLSLRIFFSLSQKLWSNCFIVAFV